MTSTKTTLLSALTAVTLGAVLSSAAPAEAKSWKHHHGGVIAAGVIGGLALGALAASTAPVYAAPVYYAPTCYKVRQPVTNSWGHILYYRTVRVCE